MGQTSYPIPPGWEGGFAQSNPAFAYPDPDLCSLPMLANMANIGKLQRQQAVLWPEFSWETDPGNSASRCYQMFAPDISRLGYDDTGRVYSIICPQQGVCTASLGCLNVEVTVTGQRGWVDEPAKTLAADMEVTGQIWFSPSAKQNSLVRWLWNEFVASNHPFPHDKLHAIQVTTFDPGKPDQPIFPLRQGESTDFAIPEFARHASEGLERCEPRGRNRPDQVNRGSGRGRLQRHGHGSLQRLFREPAVAGEYSDLERLVH